MRKAISAICKRRAFFKRKLLKPKFVSKKVKLGLFCTVSFVGLFLGGYSTEKEEEEEEDTNWVWEDPLEVKEQQEEFQFSILEAKTLIMELQDSKKRKEALKKIYKLIENRNLFHHSFSVFELLDVIFKQR